jgi:N-acylneuraminate cytidylyltransferase
MANLAIITARGGSKRIPRKNIRPFLGKPIIAYAIEAARQSGLFSEVMVSTDDPEIADIARRYGATIPFLRSASTADDFATTADVLLEVLTQYEQQYQLFDFACCIYPTAPFITASLLANAFDQVSTQGFDTVYPVQAFGFPVQRAVGLNAEQRVHWLQPEHQSTRSQDLEKAYHDSGQFYFFNVAAFQKNRQLISDNAGAIVISEMQAHDIDTEEDWQVAEFKFRLLAGDNKSVSL